MLLTGIVDILLPPASLLLIALVLLLTGRKVLRVLGTVVLGVAVLLSLPATSGLLLGMLRPPPAAGTGDPAAIVILSGDAVEIEDGRALEPGDLTLQRLRTGAELARRTGLPVLVSGGRYANSPATLADMMAAVLRQDFGVDARWKEGASRDTWENAFDSAAILLPLHIARIYLVTDSWSEPRAMLAFRRAGLNPLAAPVPAGSRARLTVRDFLPMAHAFHESYYAIHEWVGLLYYRFRTDGPRVA